jgi:ABC-type antimicrobial peptide transport system permease subunit
MDLLSLSFLPMMLAAFDATTVGVADFQSIITALTGQISVSTIVAVIASVVGITVGIAFMWWGARYASRKIMAALKKGKTGA